jgi:DNA-binding beta-propeller fold protein YncE
MALSGVMVVVIGLVVVVLAALAVLSSMFRKVGPNQALIVYGLGGTRVIKGGGAIVWDGVLSSGENHFLCDTFQLLWLHFLPAIPNVAPAQFRIERQKAYIDSLVTTQKQLRDLNQDLLGALASINPADGKLLGQARLAGHPESFQLERSGSRIFVNVPDANQIAVVERAGMTVAATWPVVTAHANYPMALDEPNHRLFIGCRRPATVLVYDTTTGRQTGAFDIVGDTDDLFFDAARKRLYVSGGEGFVDVFQEQEAGRFTRVAHVATAAGARTSLFVPDQSRLYLAVPHRGNQKAELRIYEAR